MSLVGSYRVSSSASGSTCSNTIVNFSGFKLSGLTYSNGLACCLYVWNPTTSKWTPMIQP